MDKKLLQSCLLSEAAAGMLMSSSLLLARGAESCWQAGREFTGKKEKVMRGLELLIYRDGYSAQYVRLE